MTENGTERVLGRLLAHQENSSKQLARIETTVKEIAQKHDSLVGRIGVVEKAQAESRGAWKTVSAVSAAFLAIGALIMNAIHKFWWGT